MAIIKKPEGPGSGGFVPGATVRTIKDTLRTEAVKAKKDVNARMRWARHKGRDCEVCKHKDLAEIEEAYKRWYPLEDIAEEYGVLPRILKAHSVACGWADFRAAHMDPLYAQLMNSLMEHFEPEKIAGKDAIDALIKLGRQRDKIDGRIIDRVDIESRKAVIFLSAPMPGGAPPVFPRADIKALAKAPLIEAQFENEDKAANSAIIGRLPEGTSNSGEPGVAAQNGQEATKEGAETK